VGDPFEVGREVRVAGGALHVAAAGPRPSEAAAVVLAAHGITASHVGWRAVARELLSRRSDVCLLAPDLRGRGRSATVGPPYGIAMHVADLLGVLDEAGVRRAVLAGHSMGAFVAARLAAERPERAGAVVLVDGGLRLPARTDVDADQVLDAVLGPAIARLRMTFASVQEYVAFWQAHPAFAGRWTEDVESYVRADLAGEPGDLRSIVSEAAVRTDGADLLADEATLGALERVRAPLRLLRAPRGLLDDDNPLIPRAVLDAFAAAHPSAVVEEVPAVNHYTITLGAGAATVAAAIAAAVDDAVA
jgi:pimeloyl-ACP methyl ester carboxylesterase